MKIVQSIGPTDELLSEILGRDAALWITEDEHLDASAVSILAALVRLPWRVVLIEPTSGALITAIERTATDGTWDRIAGFLHVLSSDPSSLIFPRRAQPILFLNGRDDRAIGAEAAQLSKHGAQRRRLNMLALLRGIEPKRVVIVGRNPLRAVDELGDLWGDQFRALLTVVSPDTSIEGEVIEHLKQATDLPSITWVRKSPRDFCEALTHRATTLAQETAALTRVALPNRVTLDFDLMEAEIAEQPLLDACDLIQVRDLLPLTPQDVSEQDFRQFFTKSFASWRPYAAGLPWLPNPEPERELLKTLATSLTGPSASPCVVSIVSEAGAGGTTQARALAFAAARSGYPTILVKQESPVPSSLEVSAFLYRAVSLIEHYARIHNFPPQDLEPAWLLVFDVQHFDHGGDELWRFLADLARSGRKIVILKIVSARAPLQPPRSIDYRELVEVNHDLDQESVASLGNHLNQFLRPFGKDRTVDEWRSFWRSHKPDMDTSLASFWIALEFWLAGRLKLGESVQGWIHSQFKNLDMPTEVKSAILEIASLSIERRPLSERLLAVLAFPRLPWSQVLEECRKASPGLGLTQGQSVPYGRVWALAHDLLARYLLNAVWSDRLLCGQLALDATDDSVDLRLQLIRNITRRSSMAEIFARPFAIDLATRVLKIDEQNGNPEFFRHWRKVLLLFDEMPSAIRATSRAFNHHVAISRRRVTQSDIFQTTTDEKRALLLKAASEVEFALERIDAADDDEPDLNLYNTLALLYQDLASLERATAGNEERVAFYLQRSDEYTRRALRNNPNNSYVLETAAKNLLRQDYGSDHPRRVQAAAEALSYVFQASRLENAGARSLSLSKLASEALKSLQVPSADSAIDSLCANGNGFGYVAKAWRAILDSGDFQSFDALDAIASDTAASAIAILRESPQREWLLIRLEYDLEVIAHPSAFDRQLALLDELAETGGYSLAMQQRLERAVLLHEIGRHRQAATEFQSIRRDVRAVGAVLFVPDRLRWLLTPDGTKRALCKGHVMDSSSGRPLAQVSELSRTLVPFSPQEFGKSYAKPGDVLTCHVQFSAMGPFLKPVEISAR